MSKDFGQGFTITGSSPTPQDEKSILPPMMLIGAKLADYIANDQLFKVTAADFNGKMFDGAPIVPVKKNSGGVEWMKAANIGIGNPGCTDYAPFNVTDPETHLKSWAGPGDYLFRTTPDGFTAVVIPGGFLTPLIGN